MKATVLMRFDVYEPEQLDRFLAELCKTLPIAGIETIDVYQAKVEVPVPNP